MKNVPLYLQLAVLLFLTTACDIKMPEDEANLVPWGIMTGKLAYSRNDSWNDKRGEALFVINAETETIDLVAVTEDYHFNNMSWKPDGSSITFAHFNSDTYNRWGLYSVNTSNGTIEEYITNSEAHIWYPAWSMDGRLIYAFNGSNYTNDIFINGESFLSIRNCNSLYSRAALSPDSQFLVASVFGSIGLPNHSQGELYKFKVDDIAFVEPLMLPIGEANGEIFSNPIYSPDGTKIAFTKWGDAVNGTEIWIIGEDGSNAAQLTSGNEDWNPCWSPDGTLIAFSRSIPLENDEGFSRHIFLVNINSGDIMQITKNPGENPSWIP